MTSTSDEANESIAKGMTYGGGGGAVFFGWDANTVGMVCGVVIGVLGLLLTWYFKSRQDRREQAEFERRMSQYE